MFGTHTSSTHNVAAQTVWNTHTGQARLQLLFHLRVVVKEVGQALDRTVHMQAQQKTKLNDYMFESWVQLNVKTSYTYIFDGKRVQADALLIRAGPLQWLLHILACYSKKMYVE